MNIVGTNIVIGDTLNDVISGTSLATPTGGFNVTENSRLLNFSAQLNGGNNGVNLVAIDDASTSIAQASLLGTATKLDEIVALNPSGDWQNVISALNSLTNDGQLAKASDQTSPSLSGATNTAIIETMATALRIVQTRDESRERNLWMKTFGSFGNQGNKDGRVGYDSDAYGFIAGADKNISDKTRLGIAASYFNSKLSSNNDYNKVNVDSLLGIIYSNYQLDKKTEVNAQVAVGYNRNNSVRYINFGDLNRTTKGSYDGWNFSAGTGVSRLVKINQDTEIIPQARLDYFLVENESYSESGANVLDLNVASQKQAQLIPALEVKANHNFTSKFLLSLNAGLGYDLLHDENSVTASFAGGGGDFTTHGFKPSPWVKRSGAGLTWKKTNALDLSANYDRRDRGNYNNQTFSLKFHMKF